VTSGHNWSVRQPGETAGYAGGLCVSRKAIAQTKSSNVETSTIARERIYAADPVAGTEIGVVTPKRSLAS
jgi:hypothetical protein